MDGAAISARADKAKTSFLATLVSWEIFDGPIQRPCKRDIVMATRLRLANGRAPMISERELWACAHQVLKQHGAKADAFVAERVAMLATAQDEAGVRTWRAIARRLDRLRDATDQGALRH